MQSIERSPIRRPVLTISEIRKQDVPVQLSEGLIYLNGHALGPPAGDCLPRIAATTELRLSSGVRLIIPDTLLPVKGSGRTMLFTGWQINPGAAPKALFTAQEPLGAGAKAPYRLTAIRCFEPTGMKAVTSFYSATWQDPQFPARLCAPAYTPHVVPGVVGLSAGSEIRSSTEYFVDVHTVKVGDVLLWEYAFSRQWWWRQAELVMTDGILAVPEERPRTEREWERWPECRFLANVRGKAWGHLLKAIDGMFRVEVLARVKTFGPSTLLPIVRQRMTDARKGAALRPPPRTACFGGYGQEPEIVIQGAKTRKQWSFGCGHGTVKVIDSPDVAACYVFLDLAAAQQWLNFDPGLSWSAARDRAVARIIHREGWERVLDDTLAGLAVPEASAAIGC